MLGISAATLYWLAHMVALSVSHDSYDFELASNELFLEELDTFLAFRPEDLGFASFHEDIERLQHGIIVHTMKLYEIVSTNLHYKNEQHNHTLRHGRLPLHKLINRQNRPPLPRPVNPIPNNIRPLFRPPPPNPSHSLRRINPLRTSPAATRFLTLRHPVNHGADLAQVEPLVQRCVVEEGGVDGFYEGETVLLVVTAPGLD